MAGLGGVSGVRGLGKDSLVWQLSDQGREQSK